MFPINLKHGTIYHSVVTVQRVGVQPEALPVLVLEDGSISETVLSYSSSAHARFSSLSLSTKRRTVHSLGQLYSFYKASGSPILGSSDDLKRLLNEFNKALVHGTIQKSSSGIEDPTGLWWQGMDECRAAQVRYNVEQYIYYCFFDLQHFRFDNQSEKLFVETLLLSAKEESRFSRSPYSFFTNLANRSSLSGTAFPTIPTRRTISVKTRGAFSKRKNPLKFPLDRRMDLIIHGSCRKGRSPHDSSTYSEDPLFVRDQLLFMLILFGGPRDSEITHIFTQDVVPSDKIRQQVIVSLVDPEDGLTWMEGRGEVPRSQYLWDRFRMRPLTQNAGARHAGWKGMMLDDDSAKRAYLVLVALPQEYLHFRHVLRIYTEIARPKLLKKPSPYLFLTKSGDPMTPRNIRDAWNSACKRIGLIGYSPHSGRHMIGDLIRNRLNLGPTYTQKILHHRSALSQAAYTLHEPSEIQNKICQAFENLISGCVSPDNIAKADLFIRIDPEQHFSDFLGA